MKNSRSLKFRFVASTLHESTQTPLLQTRLPALRAALDCVTLDVSIFNFTSSVNPRIGSLTADFSAIVPLPENCQRGGSGGNESSIEIQETFSLRSNTSYVGKLLDVHVGPFDNVVASSVNEFAPHTQIDNHPGCPSLAFIYGYVDVNNPGVTSAGAMICTQRLDQISTTVTFTSANMSISLLHPPIPDETTATPIPNTPNHTIDGKTYVPYRIQQHFDKTFVSNDQFPHPRTNVLVSGMPCPRPPPMTPEVPFQVATHPSTPSGKASSAHSTPPYPSTSSATPLPPQPDPKSSRAYRRSTVDT